MEINSDSPYLAPFASMTDGELRDPKQLVGLARACDPEAHPERLNRGLFIAESVNVIERAFDAGCQPFAVLCDERWYTKAASLIHRLQTASADVPVLIAPSREIQAITGYRETRGPLCAFVRPPEPSLTDIIRKARRVAILEDITNYTNIGAIFRSAAALGIDGVLLSPGCHDPLFRRASRVSMGTVFQVPWTRIGTNPDWTHEAMNRLHQAGFIVAALALSDDAVPLDSLSLDSSDKLALVLGTEGDGLASQTIAACDITLRIPMAHGVDSLNVAAASAVAFWETRVRTCENNECCG